MKKVLYIVIALILAAALIFAYINYTTPKNAIERIEKNNAVIVEIQGEKNSATEILLKEIEKNLGVSASEKTPDSDADIFIGLTKEDDDLTLSSPYASEYIQVPDEKYPLLASVDTIYYYAAVKNDSFEKPLLERLNNIINNALSAGTLPAIDQNKDGIGVVDKSTAYIYENNPILTPVNYDSPNILCKSNDMGQEYQDKLIIVCDSPTYWMKPFKLLSGGSKTTQIWTGPTGTQTFPYYKGYKLYDPYDGEERLLVDMAKLHQPEIMIVALGINGIVNKTEERFSSIYKQMILDLQEACPNTTFICASIYPVVKGYKHWDSINNEVISRGNSWILKICEETGCFYLDTNSVFLNDQGNAKPELMRNDGLHPTAEGLQLVLDYIRTHACVKKTK